MKQDSPTPSLETVTLRASTEWLWGGIGMGAAAISASFAAYMLAFGPVQPGLGTVSDFGLLARMKPRERMVESRATPLLRGGSARSPASGAPPDAAAANPVDFAPTGSVDEGAAERAGKPLPAAAPRAADAPLASFILRDVFDGKALVESPSALTLVAPGSVLAGAGEVLSIERRNKGWVVTTTRGVIAEAAP